jgi:hypothetical protein
MAMIDRRRWFTTAASLAAGLFILPGRAAAGFFRRNRCPATVPPCPAYVPARECVPCHEAAFEPTATTGCTISITQPPPPPPVPTVPHVQFTAKGNFTISQGPGTPAAGNPQVQVELRYTNSANNTSSPKFNVDPSTGKWQWTFNNVATGMATLTAALYPDGTSAACANTSERISIT